MSQENHFDFLDFANGDEVQALYPYGVGIDCHRDFIEICIFVREGGSIRKYEGTYNTSWDQLKKANEWVKTLIRAKSKPTILPDPLRYTLESTSTYHLPVTLAFEGKPSLINPLLASPTRRKTDKIDARFMAYNAMTGLWPSSFLVSKEVQAFRLLMKQRNVHQATATAISNRINNYLLRFGHTVGSAGSVRGATVRALVEDMCSPDYVFQENMYNGLSAGDYICPEGLPVDVKKLILEMYAELDRQNLLKDKYEKQALQTAKNMEWETRDGWVKGSDIIKKLITIPSVGEIMALVWLSEVATPLRFEVKEKLVAFCGCDPSLKVSAGKVTSYTRRSANTKLHHHLVKIAGTCIQRHKEPFGQWGYSIMKRHAKGGYKKACGAVARRIAIAMYFIHLTNQPFTYEKYNFFKIDVDDKPLEEMGFSSRVYKILNDNGLSTSKDVAQKFLTSELHQLKGFGPKSITEVDAWIQQNNKGKVGNKN